MSSFFKTEAGHLTLAFIVIVIGACIIRAGLASGATALLGVGAAAVLVALCAVPFRTYVIKPIAKKQSAASNSDPKNNKE
jgi:amino acid permease